MAANPLLEKLDWIQARFDEVAQLITQSDVMSDMKRYAKLGKEYKELDIIVKAGKEYRQLIANIEEAKEILESCSCKVNNNVNNLNAFFIFTPFLKRACLQSLVGKPSRSFSFGYYLNQALPVVWSIVQMLVSKPVIAPAIFAGFTVLIEVVSHHQCVL